MIDEDARRWSRPSERGHFESRRGGAACQRQLGEGEWHSPAGADSVDWCLAWFSDGSVFGLFPRLRAFPPPPAPDRNPATKRSRHSPRGRERLRDFREGTTGAVEVAVGGAVGPAKPRVRPHPRPGNPFGNRGDLRPCPLAGNWRGLEAKPARFRGPVGSSGMVPWRRNELKRGSRSAFGRVVSYGPCFPAPNLRRRRLPV